MGGFDFIPAQSGRSIDAEAGLVWDATGGPFNNRIYLVYTDETVNENNDTDIEMRTSTDDGATWSAPVRVNDDATTNSQFLPYVALDPTTGTVAVGFHDCRNDNGVPGPGGTNMIPNDDAEYYGTFSTDGGATWAPNRRLSGGFSNAADAANGIDFGDYVGLSAFAGKLYAMWADNANCDGTNPNGTLHQFDLYASPLVLTGGTPTPTPTASPTPTATATATATPHHCNCNRNGNGNSNGYCHTSSYSYAKTHSNAEAPYHTKTASDPTASSVTEKPHLKNPVSLQRGGPRLHWLSRSTAGTEATARLSKQEGRRFNLEPRKAGIRLGCVVPNALALVWHRLREKTIHRSMLPDSRKVFFLACRFSTFAFLVEKFQI